MTENEIKKIMEKQKSFFESGKTRDVSVRKAALKKLYKTLDQMSGEIAYALKKDLGKSRTESFMCETGMAMSEINWLIHHIDGLAKERRVRTPAAQFASGSYIKPSPYGQVLIMSPWNYPLLLSADPLADAVAAGNTAVIKPGAYAPESSAVLKKLIERVFPEEWVSVATGGRTENEVLLEQKWDYIFFTGSQSTGKLVLEKAAQNLTPVTLELGGKSPCIVDESADIPLSARRIVWGKFLNCGQTCVAPDYLLCKKEVKERLIKELEKQIAAQFGSDPLSNEDYGKIINEKHFERILRLIDADKTVIGGKSNYETLKIEPTVLDNAAWEDAAMREEIFGPVLPVLTYDDIRDIPEIVNNKAKPLALYIFSKNKSNISFITEYCSFGGGCVNDCVIHLATPKMPFGGVGESGMGAYHGKTGFETFTHMKSIVDKKTWFDMPVRYQPFTGAKEKMIEKFMK